MRGMPGMPMHEDQVEVAAGTVRALVADQFPEWVGLDVREVRSAGTDNAVFRIGDDLAARFPLRREDPDRLRAALAAEAAAARELALVSPVPTPVPVALGEPGHGYPSPWSVQTWLPGHDATVEDPAHSLGFAEDLAALLTRLRSADTRGRRFAGGGRGGDLTDHDAWMEVCFARSEGLLDVGRLRRTWAGLRTLPAPDSDVMCHGDLTPPNVLVERGRLAGVLDGGGFAAADPALDLVAVWHLLDDGPRQVVREALRCSEVQWRRGMAWAFEQSVGLVWYYRETNPGMSRWGRRTLDRLLAGADG
ncbi:phosphotransferase [Geodermatophilus bullaregiensis]|uniref:phosphotransferase n=1 Tax=Geodermatophilus bullaregiensis TaxID=1564160 RepID=UPI001EF809FA|nr:phosphotransferase [Geodermatophilus bullaregiensis]